MAEDVLARHARSWYGLPVEIVIEGDYWHWVKAGPVPLPHPPVVNLIVRHGLPRDARLRLSYAHEMGHIQTLPLALMHLAWVWQHRPRGQGVSLWRRLAWLAGLAVVHQSAWELAAETYVLAQNPAEYTRSYQEARGNPAPWFWALMALLALVGTFVLTRTQHTTEE